MKRIKNVIVAHKPLDSEKEYKLVTRGYHLYALPTARRRVRVLVDWALTAAAAPDSVAFGLVPRQAALAESVEQDQTEVPSRSPA